MSRTKKLVVGAVAVGVVGVVVAVAWTAGLEGGAGRPALEAPAVVELGEHEDGSIAAAWFTLRNAGNAELLLTDFRTDCSCNVLETEVGGRIRHSAGIAAGQRRSGRGKAPQVGDRTSRPADPLRRPVPDQRPRPSGSGGAGDGGQRVGRGDRLAIPMALRHDPTGTNRPARVHPVRLGHSAPADRPGGEQQPGSAAGRVDAGGQAGG